MIFKYFKRAYKSLKCKIFINKVIIVTIISKYIKLN